MNKRMSQVCSIILVIISTVSVALGRKHSVLLTVLTWTLACVSNLMLETGISRHLFLVLSHHFELKFKK